MRCPLSLVGRERAGLRDEIARSGLIRQAEESSDRGDHERALDAATRAGRLRWTASLRLLVAQEHNSLGHVLDALAQATLCESEAQANSGLNNRDRLLSACSTLARSLQQRVGQLTVEVPSPAPDGLRVRVQDGELSQALWGVGSPVLPGAVLIEAEAPSGERFSSRVEVAAGGASTVRVVLTAPDADPHAAAATTAAAATAATATATTATADRTAAATADRRAGRRPWIVVGSGGAIFATGLIFLGLRASAISNRDAACDATGCDPGAQTNHDRAALYSNVVNAAFVAGGVAVTGGLLWYFLTRPRPSAAHSSAVRLNLAPSASGAILGLSGSF